MSLFGLSLAYIRARALNAALNLVLLALGVGMIVLLLLFSAQLEDRLTRDARGIDLVIGSKGSPAADSVQHLSRRFSDREHSACGCRALGGAPAGGGSDSAGNGRQLRWLPHPRHRTRLR
jgi:hypothetical protein